MKQLIFSNGTAPTFVDSLLGAGQLAIVGETEGGFEELNSLGGGLLSDSPAIRLVQAGLPGDNANIVSPWIKGVDVVGWAGTTFRAQTPQQSTLTFSAVPVADGEVSIKLISSEQGIEKFNRKSVTIAVLAAATVASYSVKLFNALIGKPSTFVPVNGQDYPISGITWAVANYSAASIITVTGTTFSLPSNTDLSSFRTAADGLNGSNGALVTVASVATPDLGAGDAFVLQQMENSLQGDRSYYNRISQPNTPNTYVNLASEYSVYTIRVKNNHPGTIAGVDNFRNITIAYVDGGADQANFEADMNGYLASCPGAFAAVTL